MRRVLVLGTLALWATVLPGQDLRTSIDSFVSRQIAVDSFSGVVALSRSGQIVYQRAAGIANREARLAMALDTKLQIASVTKLFTNIAIRQLEQAGKLSLSDPVGKFLPAYPNPVVRSRVTIEQLMRHRSGVGSFWNERYMARRADIRTVQDYLELFQDDSLLFAPGTGEAYSNGGYVLLGAIIEKVSAKSYHDYLREHVFRPAGMTETHPYDRRVSLKNAAIGYTTQPLGGPMTGDRRLAGRGPRPGYDTAGAATARRTAEGGARRPNTSFKPGVSSPAGDHFSTVGDFLKLAAALTSYRLLDSIHTAALLGPRYTAGGDFRANGGAPGVNAEFSVYRSGDVMIVLSNYDPPSATSIAQLIRSQLQPPQTSSSQLGLKEEIDSLHSAMLAAFKSNPASVAQFYTDDAKVIGMGQVLNGKSDVERYWRQSIGASDWTLETIEIGGTRDEPWLVGRSTLVSASGRRIVTNYVGILRRGTDGKLRYRIDLFTPAERPMMRPP